MDFEKVMPEWKNKGNEPSETLKENGFKGTDRLPATILNWFIALATGGIKEIQDALKELSAEEIGALPIEGGTLSGALTVIDNFNVNKTFDDVEYKTYIRPINYSVASNGDYSTGLIHYKGSTNQAQLVFNKDGVMLRDNVNGKAYQIYGQYNTDLLKSLFLPLNGGVLSGNLDFKKVDNGSATIYKNHNATADYGLIIRDVLADGSYSQLLLSAADNTFKYRDTAGKTSNISKIQTGSYDGGGTIGGTVSQQGLTFNFVPKIVIVSALSNKSVNTTGSYYTGIFVYGSPMGIILQYNDSSSSNVIDYPVPATWTGNSLRWKGEKSNWNNLDVSGITYNTLAIG